MAKRIIDPGVYRITNTVSQKFYVGSSVHSIKARWATHKSSLKRGKHANRHLQSSWNKYGESVFTWEVLEYTSSECALIKEQYYMDTLKPQYNISPTARNTSGVKKSKATRKKIGLSKIGNKNNLGRVVSQEEKDQISSTLKETYRNGYIHPMLGRSQTSKAIEAVRKHSRGNSYRMNNPTYINFEQIDVTTGKIIATYPTAKAICDAFNHYDSSTMGRLTRATRDTWRTVFGYYWKAQVKPEELQER